MAVVVAGTAAGLLAAMGSVVTLALMAAMVGIILSVLAVEPGGGHSQAPLSLPQAQTAVVVAAALLRMAAILRESEGPMVGMVMSGVAPTDLAVAVAVMATPHLVMDLAAMVGSTVVAVDLEPVM